MGAAEDGALEDAILANDAREAAQCLDRGASVNARARSGGAGKTALMTAANCGRVECLRLLLDRGAGIHAADFQGWTPLIHATIHGHLDCLRLLLDRGAAVEARDCYRRTALVCAAVFGHGDCLRLLLDRGASIEAADNSGWTALSHAVLCNFFAGARELLERGADPAAASRVNDGVTPLAVARRKGFEEGVALLEDPAAIARLRQAWLWAHSPDVLAVRMLARRHLRLVEGPSMKQQEADMYGDLAVLSPDLLAKIARAVVARYLGGQYTSAGV